MNFLKNDESDECNRSRVTRVHASRQVDKLRSAMYAVTVGTDGMSRIFSMYDKDGSGQVCNASCF